MDALLEKLVEENRPFTREGRVAGYIPELAKADRDELGICVVSSDGRISSAGEYRRTFTIQSIIKPILLLLALMDNGEDTVRARVGVEATGKPFDAINYTDQALLSEHLNPMVNMGAILLCTLIHGTSYSQRLERLLELTRRLAGDPSLSVDEAVYRSEKQTGSRNRAMAFLLESCGLLHDDPEEVLDCYFRACSIRVDCRDLAHIACTFAGRGRRSPSGERLFPARYAHYVNRHVQRLGGLRRQSGTASQKRRGGRHHGGLPCPYGHRHLFPRAGRKGKQSGWHPAAGTAGPPAQPEHILTPHLRHSGEKRSPEAAPEAVFPLSIPSAAVFPPFPRKKLDESI